MRKIEVPALASDIFEGLQGVPMPTLAELIATRKKELNITDLQMATILKVDKSTFGRLLKRIASGEVQGMDYYLVVKISQLFGIDVSELTKIYVGSLPAEHIGEIEQARKANFLLTKFDLKGLKDFGFIDNASDLEAVERRIVDFFCLKSIFDFSREVGYVLFSMMDKSHDKMREFWVKSSHFQFEKIANPNPFDRDALEAMIPNIRPYTRYEEKGMLTVVKALFNVGVTVIVQPYLPRTKVRGGTFAVDGKPYIVLTDFNDSYPTLWFALLHELFHVLFDFEQLKKLKYHLTEDDAADLFLFREDDADWFAREILFPQEQMNYIKHLINSPKVVARYAEEKGVHPGIIYSFFCYQQKREKGKNLYPLFQQYFGKPDKTLKAIQSNPWGKATIYEEIEIIKQKLTT